MMKSLGLFVCSGSQCTLTDSINSQEKFAEIIERERARSDRNGHGFSIISYEMKSDDINKPSVQKLLTILPKRMRITDEIGWFDDQHIGLLLYSSKLEDARSFARQIESAVVSTEESAPKYSIYPYPSSSDWPGSNGDKRNSSQNLILTANHKLPKWKRFVDVAGASLSASLCVLHSLHLLPFLSKSSHPALFSSSRRGSDTAVNLSCSGNSEL